MNPRAIVIAAPLVALVAAIAIRQSLGRRQSVEPRPKDVETAPDARNGSSEAGETSANPEISAAARANPRLRAIGEAIETSYASTLAAFALHGEEAEYETHDAQARRDAERLQQLFSSVRAELSPELARSCEAIVDRIAAAQLQLMAFAINRKNHGLPDSAQAEAEIADRKAFQENAAPLFERIKAALGVGGLNISPVAGVV